MADIGTIIQGKYEILKLVGKGGMSKVYLAMDQNLNKQWAVKEIEKRARDKNNQVVIQSAMTEANLMKKLDHPSLPRIVDIIDKADSIYVVMDYIEGEPLSNVLNKYGAQPQETVIQWARELCMVLDYLHTQTPPIIYRDMKPANVMLQPNGSVKLIDFGVAREYKAQNLADTVSLGTKGYAAPEMFGGRGQTDARTDVYCLGVTLYHLLTGQNPCDPPYEIYPIRYWNPQLSSGLESIILKCTQMNPADRYQSCAELLYALNHYEEMDETYRRKQKKRFHMFAGMLIASAVSLAVGFTTQGMKSYVNNSDYDNNILQAKNSSASEEKIDYYVKAIDIKPTEISNYEESAYGGMITEFKADGKLVMKEEEQLKKTVNKNLSGLREQEEYGKLAFEVGKLYWYYYSYGETESTDNEITKMKSAIQWFEDACEYGGEKSDYYMMAKTYSEIGKFNRDITLLVQEATDKEIYIKYWKNLNELVEIVGVNPDESELVSLEVYRLSLNAIETYARKFKADGVAQDDMQLLFEKIKVGVRNITPTTDTTEKLKKLIVSGEVQNTDEQNSNRQQSEEKEQDKEKRFTIVQEIINNTYVKEQEVQE